MRFHSFKKIVAAFLLTAVMCSLFVGCSNKPSKPEDTIEMLENAINSFDVDSIMACIDEDWSSQIEKVLSFSVDEKGMSIASYITLLKTVMPALPFVTDGAIDPDKLPKVEFTILKTDIADGSAVVALSGVLNWGEFSKPFAATIDMELQNETWVVCGIR